MWWWFLGFVLVLAAVYTGFRKILQKFNFTEGIPPVRVVRGRSGFKRISFYYFSIPFFDGLCFLHLFQKYGMTFLNHLASTLPWDDTYEVPLGPFRVICTLDPSVSGKILNSSDPGHLSRPKLLETFLYSLRHGIIVTPFEIWTKQRKITSHAFTFRCIQSYIETMNTKSKTLVKNINTILANGDGTLKGKQFWDCIHTTIGKVTLEFIIGPSEEIGDWEDATQFLKDVMELKGIALFRFIHPKCYLPLVWWLHPKRKRGAFLEKRILSFVLKVIEHHKLKSARESGKSDSDDVSKVTKKCLVEEMLAQGATSEEINYEVLSFLVGGVESSTTAINILLHHLACFPEYQARCRNEVDNVLGRNYQSCVETDYSDEFLDVDKLSKLEYLERFISESLRITPTLPFTARELYSPLKINEDLTFKRGDILVVSPWLIHHNPKYYPEPEIFNPDRFLPEEVKKRESGTYIPFSTGYRNCIGRRFAMVEFKIITGWLLRNFELLTEDGLHDVQLNFEITLKPKRQFRTYLRRRRSE